jgi:hypothetical protein
MIDTGDVNGKVLVKGDCSADVPEGTVLESYFLHQALQEPPNLELLVNDEYLNPWATKAEIQDGHVAQLKLASTLKWTSFT